MARGVTVTSVPEHEVEEERRKLQRTIEHIDRTVGADICPHPRSRCVCAGRAGHTVPQRQGLA